MNEPVTKDTCNTPDAKKTVQEYLDETPCWSDGTNAPGVPMTRMQWRIWWLATAGKFFEGLVIFMTGVALPLIVKEFGLSAMEKGAVGAAPLLGILIGATALGGLSDCCGRKRMFVLEMGIFALFLGLLVFSPNYVLLLVFLFGMGLALGCDYPTAHMVISESIPSKDRGKLVLGAFGFQAVGALVGTAIGYLVLYKNPEVEAWRWMYATAVVPALLVIVGRLFIVDSAHWLVSRGRISDAEDALARLLARTPAYPQSVYLKDPRDKENGNCEAPKRHLGVLFNKQNRRATIFAAVPWFLQDLGTYGIGLFTPTVLGAVIGSEVKYAHNLMDIINNDMLAAKGAAFVDVLLLFGIFAAIALADKAGRLKLQFIGFIGCAVGLVLAALSLSATGTNELLLLFGGFMLFNFMTNMGPNSMTYLLSGEVFPTHIRGLGAGFAASFAKAGAVLTAFLFPIFLNDIGTQNLLYLLAATSLLGAYITKKFGIETKGINLESIGVDTMEDDFAVSSQGSMVIQDTENIGVQS